MPPRRSPPLWHGPGWTAGRCLTTSNNKAGLFYAVYTELEGELLQGIVQRMAAAEGDEWQQHQQHCVMTAVA